MAAVAEAEERLEVQRNPETMGAGANLYARHRQAAGKDCRRFALTGRKLGAWRDHIEELRAGGGVALIFSEIRAAGARTLEQVAKALNALGIPSARGSCWYPMQVTRIEKRLAAAAVRDTRLLEVSLSERPLSTSKRTCAAPPI